MSKDKLRGLVRRSTVTGATVWVGKSGLTSEVLSQINRQLDSREFIKIKVHKSGIGGSSVDVLAAKIASDTRATLVNVRGRTFSLFRQMKKKPKRVGK